MRLLRNETTSTAKKGEAYLSIEKAIQIPLEVWQNPQGDVILNVSESECAVYFGCWNEDGSPAEYLAKITFKGFWSTNFTHAEYIEYEYESLHHSYILEVTDSEWHREIENRMNDIATGKLGELTIAATYLPATVLLPKYIAMFKAKNIDVKINVVTGNSKEAFALLYNHKADVAIIGGGWEQPNIHWEHLFDDELWFVVPSDHSLANREATLHEMMEETFVIREDGSSTRERFLSMCRTFNVRQPKIGM